MSCCQLLGFGLAFSGALAVLFWACCAIGDNSRP